MDHAPPRPIRRPSEFRAQRPRLRSEDEDFWIAKGLLTDDMRREVAEILKRPKRVGRVWRG